MNTANNSSNGGLFFRFDPSTHQEHDSILDPECSFKTAARRHET
jgi:hypothetical protein